MAWLPGGDPGFALWRADAAALAVGILLAAGTHGAAARWRALLLAPILVGVVHLALAGAGTDAGEGAAAGALAEASLLAGVAAAAVGLAALGGVLGCPRVGAQAVAAGVLWLACAGVWWADDLAARVPADDRGRVREAVVAIDPFTAAAYGASGFDRLRHRPVYDGTILASTAVRVPGAWTGALGWGAVGLLAGAGAWLGGRRGDASSAS